MGTRQGQVFTSCTSTEGCFGEAAQNKHNIKRHVQTYIPNDVDMLGNEALHYG